MNNQFNAVIVIPCYRHATILQKNIQQIASFSIPIIIVDDGNIEQEQNKLKQLENEQITVIQTEHLGKGNAVITGFKMANERGYTHVIQIDADGQHDYKQIPEFLTIAQKEPDKLICGKPIYHNVPKHRYIARYLTHIWVSVEIGMFKIIDSMCGFRIYPIKPVMKLLSVRSIGNKMSFDTEILVRLYWAGVDFKFHELKVTYPQDGISNFQPLQDNIRISAMHTKLCIEKVLHYIKIKQRKYH